MQCALCVSPPLIDLIELTSASPTRCFSQVLHATGIAINQYQVDRATHHNDRLGVSPLADVVRGNFCEMPFPPNSFDAAYAIEATCHGE
jgi:ubiquinone/menaquinone biosynthesis C-methylase UbiE